MKNLSLESWILNYIKPIFPIILQFYHILKFKNIIHSFVTIYMCVWLFVFKIQPIYPQFFYNQLVLYHLTWMDAFLFRFHKRLI